MRQKVIIIGQGITGRLGIIRSVAQIDCEVTIIALVTRDKKGKLINKKPVDSYSQYVSRCFICEGFNAEMLLDVLMKNCVDDKQKPIIFPDNDFSAATLDQHYDLLKEHFILPHINHCQGAVAEWMDKLKQKRLAEELGISVAHAHVIKSLHEIPLGTISYPCFVKPLVSMKGRKWLMGRCDDEQSLLERINYTLNKIGDIPLLIEEYKSINREFAIVGFSDGNQVVIPGILELLHIAHGRHLGVATQGKVFPINGYEGLVEQFSNLIKKIGYCGVFDIDFYESEGINYFCELNLRFGGSGYAYTKLGVNLPAMMVESLLGNSIEIRDKLITQSAYYFNEKMAIDDWYDGFISLKELYGFRKESGIRFVQDDKDTCPQKVLDREFGVLLIKKVVKKCLGMR